MINEALDEAERVVDPGRASRLAWKTALAVVMVVLAAGAVRLVVHFGWRTEDITKTVTSDPVWFARQSEEIAAVDAEITAVSDALERKQREMKERWVNWDTSEFDRLNNRLLELRSRRAQLVKDYNTACRVVTGVAPIGS